MQSKMSSKLMLCLSLVFTANLYAKGPVGTKKAVKAYVKDQKSSEKIFSDEEEKYFNEAINNLDLSALRNKKINSKIASDELVFFDYTFKPKEEAKLRPIEKIIKKKQVIKKIPNIKIKALSKNKKPSATTKLINPINIASLSLLNQKKKKYFSKNDKVARGIVMTLDAKIGKDFGFQIKNYEFVPEYDNNERLYDDADGLIVIEEKINSSMSILRGTILKKGKMRTKVDLVIEENEFEYEIPLIDEYYFNKFLDKEKLNAIGGIILLDLDDSVDSVDIDAQYEAKIFLTESLKVTTEENTYRYIMYVGVETGNTLINVLTLDDDEVEKIIHVTENEVYFDFITFKKSQKTEFEVHENKVLSRTKFELDIDGSDISFFNTNIKSKNIGINSFQMQIPKLMYGMRQYLEFKHQDATIFVGQWNNPKIEIPSMEYIQYVLRSLDIPNLEHRCMVQVNFKKDVEEFFVSGETNNGPMSLNHYFLDRDGVFNEDATELALKAFIIGDYEGVINFKVEYSDKSVDYIQSYCSNDTYLVEHL